MEKIKEYISNLKTDDIPWGRMVTAYDTAENYPEYLTVLESMQDIKEMNEALDNISDFEHQGTLFTPAPFVLVFLVRIYKKAKQTNTPEAEWLAKELDKSFKYYLEICEEFEQNYEHDDPLTEFSDMLDEKYLLPEDYTEDDLEEYYENFMPDDCFYSLYYYSGIILKDYDKNIQ
ncbi:MAG: hypothetical protein K2N49_06700 [Ruminococcus sp.]|nr:hypothetical protein [Ruminococcus sp.]MDE7226526.1 hypothetical protein [Ruminococcus sp.]